jgi:pantothenate synthetase
MTTKTKRPVSPDASPHASRHLRVIKTVPKLTAAIAEIRARAPHEDLNTYPRSFAADRDALAAMDVDLIWAPDVATMYPDGFATRIVPEGPATVGLEDKFRPHFFSGVATVVGKLLIQ